MGLCCTLSPSFIILAPGEDCQNYDICSVYLLYIRSTINTAAIISINIALCLIIDILVFRIVLLWLLCLFTIYCYYVVSYSYALYLLS